MKLYLLIASLLASPALADHGRDFLLVLDAAIPNKLDWIVFSNFNTAVETGPDEAGFEWGATTGILPRTSLTATLQYADPGEGGWGWSAASPSLQFDLTPAGSPVLFGLLVGREFSLSNSHDEEPSHSGHPHEHPGEDDGHAVEHDEDEHEHAEDESGHEEHSGIHQHGIDAWNVRIIAETTFPGDIRLVGNLIALLPDDGDWALGYGLGIRRPLSHQLSIGVEATGDFSANDYHEAALGFYYSPIHPLTLKVGFGAGLNSQSPDCTLRTGLVWKF